MRCSLFESNNSSSAKGRGAASPPPDSYQPALLRNGDVGCLCTYLHMQGLSHPYLLHPAWAGVVLLTFSALGRQRLPVICHWQRGALQTRRLTGARGRPKEKSSHVRHSGAVGTLGNHSAPATPEGASAAQLLLIMAKQEWGPG